MGRAALRLGSPSQRAIYSTTFAYAFSDFVSAAPDDGARADALKSSGGILQANFTARRLLLRLFHAPVHGEVNNDLGELKIGGNTLAATRFGARMMR